MASEIEELETVINDSRCSSELVGIRVRNTWPRIKAALRQPTPPPGRTPPSEEESPQLNKSADAVVLAVLLHLSERSGGFEEGPFKAGFETAIEEAGAYLDSQTPDGGDRYQSLMEHMIGLLDGTYTPSPIPQGYRLVPEEPTQEMAEAFWAHVKDRGWSYAHIESFGWRYRAMLSAAPAPQAKEGEE
jgi:hypothetical protein